MLPPRAYIFLTLNAIRILSIIALLLVIASNTVTLSDDIKAVNRFVAAGNDANGTNSTSGTANVTALSFDYDYIPGSSVPNQPAARVSIIVFRSLFPRTWERLWLRCSRYYSNATWSGYPLAPRRHLHPHLRFLPLLAGMR